MKSVMFYSYKGGSGRTTAAANVAAALTKLGQKVLCVDLDIEAPGLNVLFNVPVTERVIQDYLEESERTIGLDQLNASRIDVLQFFRDESKSSLPVRDNSGLYLIPAAQEEEHVRVLPLRGTRPETRMQRLYDYYEKEMDFLILDSPSGLRNMTALALSIANRVLVFFTWSRQSLAGTVLFAKTLAELRPYHLVASQVPSPLPNWDKGTTGGFLSKMAIMERWLQRRVESEEVTAEYSIGDNPLLRVDERVVVFDHPDKETDYDRIAKGLMAW